MKCFSDVSAVDPHLSQNSKADSAARDCSVLKTFLTGVNLVTVFVVVVVVVSFPF